MTRIVRIYADFIIRLAVNEEVVIKRGNNMFHLVYRNIGNVNIDDDDDDDDDYITIDELRKSTHEIIDRFFADKYLLDVVGVETLIVRQRLISRFF